MSELDFARIAGHTEPDMARLQAVIICSVVIYSHVRYLPIR
jgi:hypothetical protein